ncbi:Protein of unknown function DUF4232 [Actinobacteria bacterium OK074]|nr:Protein of unknown function DUF4232 [Actinobacteria bacterium OK074]
MRTLPLAVTTVAAALVLTACGDDGGSADKASTCDYGIKVGPANAATQAGDTGNVPVTVTSKSAAKCTLKDFPGLEVAAGSSTWTVAHTPGSTAEKVPLNKGEAATFTITYVRGAASGDGGAAVKTLKITVPGGGSAQTFPWSYGPIAAKGSDTLDASVTSFQMAGD